MWVEHICYWLNRNLEYCTQQKQVSFLTVYAMCASLIFKQSLLGSSFRFGRIKEKNIYINFFLGHKVFILLFMIIKKKNFFLIFLRWDVLIESITYFCYSYIYLYTRSKYWSNISYLFMIMIKGPDSASSAIFVLILLHFLFFVNTLL